MSDDVNNIFRSRGEPEIIPLRQEYWCRKMHSSPQECNTLNDDCIVVKAFPASTPLDATAILYEQWVSQCLAQDRRQEKKRKKEEKEQNFR